jgi:putative zinc finger protein
MSAQEKLTRCSQVAPLLVFFVCDEVDAGERSQIEAHLAVCADCTAQLAQERRLQEFLAVQPQSADLHDAAGILLAQCRSDLSEKIDDLAHPPVQEHWRPYTWMRSFMALRPGWSAAILVLFGLVFGTQLAPWYSARSGSETPGQPVNVLAAPLLSDDQLGKMSVANINLAPSPDAAPGTLQVQLRAEQPLLLSGNVDDTDMRRVLTYVIANGKQFNSGVRLDCLEALKARSSEKEVRLALVAAVRGDRNPAVRIKALESLRDAADDDSVREAMLDALQHDDNPGVRVEAVNLLVRSLDLSSLEDPDVTQSSQTVDNSVSSADPSVVQVVRALQDLQRRDPNPYVRLRSAAALRQIASRELQ